MYKFGNNKSIKKDNKDSLLINLINGEITPVKTIKETNEILIKDYLVYSYLRDMFLGIEKGGEFIDEYSTYYNKKLISELKSLMNKPTITNGGLNSKKISPKFVCENMDNFERFLSRFYVLIKIIQLGLVDLNTLEKSLWLMNNKTDSIGLVYRVYDSLDELKDVIFDNILDINDSLNLYKEFAIGVHLLSIETKSKNTTISNLQYKISDKLELKNICIFLKERHIFELDFLLTCTQIKLVNEERFNKMFE